MPFIANVEICDWDFYNALKKADELDIPHFMYNNKVYNLEKRIKQEVFTGNKGKVVRTGNMFVLMS